MTEMPGAVRGSAHEMAACIKAAEMPGQTKGAGFKQGSGLLGGARLFGTTCGAGPVPADLPLAMKHAGFQQDSTHTANERCGGNHRSSCTAAGGRTRGKTTHSHLCPCKPTLGQPCSAHSDAFAGFQPYVIIFIKDTYMLMPV